MKKSGTTITFVLVCVAVLFASYGIGLGIRQIRFSNAGIQATTDTTKKSTNETQTQTIATDPTSAGGPEATFTRRGRDRTPEDGTPMRPQFENMSEEEMSQMRERTDGGRGGRRGMDVENLSEEERAAMEEQRRQRMEEFQNMTEEERSQMRSGRGGRGGRGGGRGG